MKVLMVPSPLNDNGASGIATVLREYGRYMPGMGVEFVKTEEDADIVAVHAGAYYPQNPTIPVVALCHGLYWTGEYYADSFEYEMNEAVINVLRRAQAVVVPSDWVAKTIQRDMRINPHVIGHGVDVRSWQPLPVKDYVLWNKNRNTDVCSPQAVNELATRFPMQKFLSTYAAADSTPNVKVTGTLAFDAMKPLVQQAEVYLASVKETFGIGILEALASGVPVLGFAEGGVLDLVTHKVDGYLATPGDYDDLATGLEFCLNNRNSLSKMALRKAEKFDWELTIQMVVNVFRSVFKPTESTVTVVIPCYNYGDKLERAVKSVIKQTKRAVEIIIVDNNSTDNTKSVANALMKKHKNVTYYNEPRQGVAHARNCGIARANSTFVCCLDADDMVEPEFLEVCCNALLADPALGLAYTGLRWVKADGTQGISTWPGAYDFNEMLAGRNCVPTCCVFRTSMWERTGGYRQRYAPDGAGAEDAEFWLRAGAIGFGGVKASDAPLFVYSMGSGYVSGNPDYREENWRAWHPYVKDELHPFASMAKPDYKSHAVYQYDRPLVSVVIPCSTAHMQYLTDALDSLEAQTFRQWEAIVVIDAQFVAGNLFGYFKKAYPHVKFLFNMGDKGGAGVARNMGAAEALGGFLLFLDADDWLEPTALVELLQAAQKPVIAYSDYYGHALMDVSEAQRLDVLQRLVEYRYKDNLATVLHYSADFDRALAQRQPELDPQGNFYLWNLITSLVPKAWHNQIGGFDEDMESWEDWDYWLRFARAGANFMRVPKPLVHYRFTSGSRREDGLRLAPKLLNHLEEKKGVTIMCCGVPTEQPVYQPPPPASLNQGVPLNLAGSDYQMIMLVDNNIGQHAIRGPITKIDYGYRVHGATFLMHKDDIDVMPHKEGHPRQTIRILAPVHNNIVADLRSPDQNLDRTDVLPHNEIREPEKQPVFVEGIPSIAMIEWLTASQQKILNGQGVFTVIDLIKLGQEDLAKVKGVGPKRAALTIAEAINLASQYA